MRRPDPARVHAAQRAGLHARMVSSWRLTPERADELLDAWAREAESRGLAPGDRDYWSADEAWMRERTRTSPVAPSRAGREDPDRSANALGG